MRFRKKPIEIEAIRWEGGDYSVLDDFLGMNWGRADAKDEVWPHAESDGEEVVIWNTAEKIWLPVVVGAWIIRGVNGEFYPCDPKIFEITYEPVE